MMQFGLFDAPPPATDPSRDRLAEIGTHTSDARCRICGVTVARFALGKLALEVQHRAPCGKLCIAAGARPPDVCWGIADRFTPCEGCAAALGARAA